MSWAGSSGDGSGSGSASGSGSGSGSECGSSEEEFVEFVHEYFDFARFAEEQKEVQRKLADGWSMKGSSRYYSNIELMVYYDPKNPRLQHVYDDVDVYSEND